MSGLRRRALRLTASLVLALWIATMTASWPARAVGAFDGCTIDSSGADAGVTAATCPLRDGATVEGALGAMGSSATYRLDTFGPDATVELLLGAPDGAPGAMTGEMADGMTLGLAELAILNWRGDVVGAATREANAPEIRLTATLPLPGAYAVRISGDASTASLPYRLSARITYPGAAPLPLWPAALAQANAALDDERRVIRVPRGGTPAAGVAAGRILSAPPDGIFGDFTLVADVTFEQIAGPAALQVRFRYEPEAGGGTGYLFSLDPFAGTATLEVFEEGQRDAIVANVPLPTMPTTDHPQRLVLSAAGPSIVVTLNGQPVIEASDGRYERGLIAIGAVTWSEPIGVLFDHVQVAAKPR